MAHKTDHTENQRKNCPLTSVIVSPILWMPCILGKWKLFLRFSLHLSVTDFQGLEIFVLVIPNPGKVQLVFRKLKLTASLDDHGLSEDRIGLATSHFYHKYKFTITQKSLFKLILTNNGFFFFSHFAATFHRILFWLLLIKVGRQQVMSVESIKKFMSL